MRSPGKAIDKLGLFFVMIYARNVYIYLDNFGEIYKYIRLFGPFAYWGRSKRYFYC